MVSYMGGMFILHRFQLTFILILDSLLQRRNWLNSRGFTPVNLDLFHRLQDCVENLEPEFRVVIFHINRGYNQIADGLAKDAAESMRAR